MRFRDHRWPCDVELTVACAGAVRRARLVNVSVSGARVEGLGDAPRDAPAILCLLEARHHARVAWSDGRRAGLRFTPPLTPAQADALRGAGGRPGAWAPGMLREMA